VASLLALTRHTPTMCPTDGRVECGAELNAMLRGPVSLAIVVSVVVLLLQSH